MQSAAPTSKTRPNRDNEMKRTLTSAVSSLVMLLLAGLGASGAFAQTVTGSFAPTNVSGGGSSTLTLLYSGFTSNSTGMNLRIYYNSTQVTPGTVSYNNPPGQSQPPSATSAGTLAGCTGADTFFVLNWVDFGGAWPTPTAGTLAAIPFTAANPFTQNSPVCWVDDTSEGAPQRNITGSATLDAPPPGASIGVSPS